LSVPEEPITELLRRASAGDRAAEHDLLERVYPDLHAMAKGHFRWENPEHTLQPTALVNEVYLKLMGECAVDWKNRAHFFAVASRAMRQILTDHARRACAGKRGGGVQHLLLDEHIPITDEQCLDVLVLDEALASLEKIGPRLVKVVVYRYFGDMTEDEIAETLGVSTRTVKRDWEFARAWLRDWLSK
jgi:RNA polymerase sigma-70 factor, ECF subfamily